MFISITRTTDAMSPVLYDKNLKGSDPMYWVFSDISKEKWENMTVLAPSPKEGELTKTFGHYHNSKVEETYKLLNGDGVMLLQKKHFENGIWIPNMVDEIYWVIFSPGDDLVISPEWGHSCSNIGFDPLVTMDNWRSGHTKADYSDIEKLQGMCFYLVRKGDQIKSIPNPNYKDLPDPKWITTKEFNKLNLHA